jgi:hypothetical protein
VPADDLGDFGVLARAKPDCGSVRELLEDFLGGEIPVGVEETLVVQDVDEIIGDLEGG